MTNDSSIKKSQTLTILSNVLGYIGMLLGALLYVPLLIGAFKIIFKDGKIPSPESSIGLAIVSGALGAVVLWFAERPKSKRNEEQQPNELARRGALASGTFFVFAALCFTLFGLLSPVFPDAIKGTDFFSLLVKWVGALSLSFGSITLGIALCGSLFDVWFWHIGR